MNRLVVAMFSISILVPRAQLVFAQNYPTKPIRIVTNNAGGGADMVARLIAQGITGPLRQQVVVDNRPAGIIPVEIVSKSLPDGYTLHLASNALWILPLLQNVPYDALRDLSPIILVATSPQVLVVHPSLPVKSTRDLIILGKSRPGALNYATALTGTASHLAAELFKSMAGINMVRVNYNGAGATLTTDLIDGQVQLAFVTGTSVMPLVKLGKLKALAVTSAKPSALYPALPTVAASGLPGYEVANSYGMFAPAKTPPTIINRLNQEIQRAVNQADLTNKFFNIGVETAGGTPEQLAAVMKSEIIRMGKVIKDAGIREE